MEVKNEEVQVKDENTFTSVFVSSTEIKTEVLSEAEEEPPIEHQQVSNESIPSPLFICSQCDLKFLDLSALNDHILTHLEEPTTMELHIENEYFTCDICQGVYLTKTFLEKHITVSHLNVQCSPCQGCDITQFKCNFCSGIYTSTAFLFQHLTASHSAQLFNTNIFHEVTEDKKMSTLISYRNIEVFECSVCHITYKQKSSLYRHLKITHSFLTYKFQCKNCPERFKSVYLKEKHEYFMHSIKPTRHSLTKCKFCPKVFLKIKQKERHEETVHSNTRPFSCHLCEQKFKTKSNLMHHLVHTHFRSKKYECEFCKKQFNQVSHLNLHVEVIHRKSKPFECDFCGNHYSQKSHLQYHILTHLDIRDFKCEVCGKGFVQKTDLKHHVASVHDKIVYNCQICSKKFRRVSDQKLHFASVHEPGVFVCNICSGTFNTKYELNSHKDESHKKHICTFCNMKFSQVKGLRFHLQEVHKLYNCDKCNVVFDSNEELLQHAMETHAVKLLNCLFCTATYSSGKRFHKHLLTAHNKYMCRRPCMVVLDTKDELEEHILKNHKQKYPCGLCGEGFSNKKDLAQHLKSAHPTYNPIECKKCNIKFDTKSEYNLHVTKVHLIYKYNCTVCSEKFSNKALYETHLKKHLLYSCSQCGEKLNNASQLEKHIRTVHAPLFNCEVHNLSFTNSYDFQEHLHSEHLQIKIEEDVPGENENKWPFTDSNKIEIKSEPGSNYENDDQFQFIDVSIPYT